MADFDIERFLIEIEARPAIWNFQSPHYANKHQKHQAWEEVCAEMIPGYEKMEVADKMEKFKVLQRKWRSLRDCYTRELNAQNQSKSGSARVDRKQYVFFNQLSFLRKSVESRKTKSSLDEDQNTSIAEDIDELLDIELTVAPERPQENVPQISLQLAPSLKTVNQPIKKFGFRPPTLTSKKRNQEQVAATKLKVLQDISKRICSVSRPTDGHLAKAEEDQDRMFLLSLLNDVKKVHEDDKLELKSEMILLIKKWQRARQTT